MATALRPPQDIVHDYEQYEVADHPFFRELRAKPVDLTAIWLLMVNLQTGISAQFIRWLATVVARVEDRRIGSLIAKQLNEELGNGNFTHIHSVLLDAFVTALGPYRPEGSEPVERVSKPGRDLERACSRLFANPDPYEGVGALMVSEIFAKKMDTALADQVRRTTSIPKAALTWLNIHEVLEVAHADDSLELANLVPASGPQLAATWRGATAQWDALWRFLTDVHALSHPATAR